MNRVGIFLIVPAILGLILPLRGPSAPFFLGVFLLSLFSLLDRKAFRKNLLITFITFLFFFAVGSWTESSNQTQLIQGEQILTGIIDTIPKIDGDTFSVTLKTDVGESVQIHAYFINQLEQTHYQKLQIGDRCKIKGTLQLPSPPTNFYQFDYRKYLKERSIHWILTPAKQGIQCRTNNVNSYYKLQKWRQNQIDFFQESVDENTSGILIALLFGERYYMDADVLEAYQRLGVIHLLAVSGLHVGLVVAASFFIFIRFGLTRERAMELLLVSLPIYALIAGAAPSVIRASTMSFIVLACLRFRVNIHPLTGIYVVCLCFLALRPYSLFQLGFQLSFLISFGLIVSASAIQARYQSKLAQLTSVTLLAQFLSLPLLLFHFFEWSWISLPLNLVYIPFISLFILPFSFLSFVLSLFVPQMLNLPIHVLTFVVPLVHEGLVTLQKQNLFMVVVGKPSYYMFLFYYGALVYTFKCWEGREKGWWKKSLALLTCFFLIQFSLPYLERQAVVTMLDVGQGDSFVIELPYRRKVYIIDTGGSVRFQEEEWRIRKNRFEVGKDVVIPYLKARGIRKVDKLILSHGHIDHIGGSQALATHINVKELYYAFGPVEGQIEKDILQTFYEQGTKISFVKEGKKWVEPYAQFAILAPIGTEDGLNNRSIVLYAVIEGVRWLFTGDLEEQGEKRLIMSYPQLKIDVLKAGHHGSKTSSNEWFVESLNPRVALISSGRKNRFGHPHSDVIKRFHSRDTRVLRTDQMGSVQVIMHQKQMEIRSVIELKKQDEF